MSENGSVLLYPFVRRNVGRLLEGHTAAEGLYDTTSLYGRGGVVGKASRQELQEFHDALGQYLKDQHVFCSFDRFHPVIGNHANAPEVGKVMDVGGFVVVDLRPSIEDVQQSFKASVRKDIRKAKRNDVECFYEGGNEHLETFLDIYYGTMDRNKAGEFHYFSKSFFSDLANALSGQFKYFYAMHDGKVVSCELVLYHGDYSHSFLGGTKKEALPLAANPMLKMTILETMQALGCKYFLLGGGYEPNDGIFAFKKAYAPQGVFPSYIGGTQWRADIYERLKNDLQASGKTINAGRFQFYDV